MIFYLVPYQLKNALQILRSYISFIIFVIVAYFLRDRNSSVNIIFLVIILFFALVIVELQA